ncbi:Uncharacterised protein [Mycobacteroides abscessus subsp. abscessus]|nr:Uncharacterised protein [Mycobacteroides abscessus subsp. abscessus]
MGAGVAAVIADDERQQYLDGAHDHQHVADREQQCGEKPGGAHHVPESLCQIAEGTTQRVLPHLRGRGRLMLVPDQQQATQTRADEHALQ